MPAAQQVANTAQTQDCPEGFDMDFAAHAKTLGPVKSLTVARTMLKVCTLPSRCWKVQ